MSTTERHVTTDHVRIARAAAALMIGHSFLVGEWIDDHHLHSRLVDILRTWLNQPLGIGQDFGLLGIMLLLITTGYSASTDTVRGLFRTYLPAAIGTLAATVTMLAGGEIFAVPPSSAPTPSTVFGNLTLASQVLPHHALLVPLSWVILIEVVCWLLTRAGSSRPWSAPALEIVLSAAGCVFGADPASPLHQLSTVTFFLPVVAVGRLVRLVERSELRSWAGGVGAVAAWGVMAWASASDPMLGQWWYPVTAAYTMLLFPLLTRSNGPVLAAVSANPAVCWLADRSRWFLVLPGIVGWPVSTALYHRLPWTVVVAVAAIAVVVATELGERLLRLMGARA